MRPGLLNGLPRAHYFRGGSHVGGATKHVHPYDLRAIAEPVAQTTIKLELPDAENKVVGQTFGRSKLLERDGEGVCGGVNVAE